MCDSLLTFQHIADCGGIGEDLQEVLRRGFAGLHPRPRRTGPAVGPGKVVRSGCLGKFERKETGRDPDVRADCGMGIRKDEDERRSCEVGVVFMDEGEVRSS